MNKWIPWLKLFLASLAFAAGSVNAAPPSSSHLPGVDVKDLVTLKGTCEGRTEAPAYRRVLSDGTVGAKFQVPKGRTLVITDIEWIGVPGDVNNFPFLGLNIYMSRAADPTNLISVYRSYAPVIYDQSVGFSNGLALFRDHLTAGIPIASGFSFDELASGDRILAGFGTPKPPFCDVHLRGYLTGL